MIIYLDTLIFVNTVIDYLILSLSLRMSGQQASLIRVVIAGFVGGISSLYILFEGSNIALDLLFKLASSCLVILITVGFCRLQNFIKLLFVFFALTLLYCGGLMFICESKTGFPIYEENLTGYFDIPTVYIIIFTGLFYLFIWIFSKLRKKATTTTLCTATVYVDNQMIKVAAMIDTGNSLDDPLSSSPVIIFDEGKYSNLLSKISRESLRRRKRVIPIKTVNSTGLLNAVRCDRLIINYDGKTLENQNVIIAESSVPLDSQIDAILPGYIMDYTDNG